MRVLVRWVVLASSFLLALACGGDDPPRGERPHLERPREAPQARPTRPRRARTVDLLDRMAKVVACDPAASRLCRVLSHVGGVGGTLRGLRVGLAVPCRDPGGTVPGTALRAALRDDWRAAELAGASFVDGRWNVFALRPTNAEEEGMVRRVHDQLVACAEGPGCELDVPDAMLAEIAAPQNPSRPLGTDDAGHLHASGELAWHLGRSDRWLVVAEGARDCAWLDLFPDLDLR